MPSVGPLSAGAGADDSSVGTLSWTSPSAITAADVSNATATVSPSGSAQTHYLKATAFGFSVPAGSTINGVVVEVKQSTFPGVGTGVDDSVVKLVVGGVVSGTNKSAGASWPAPPTYASYGGSSDLWGNALSPADVNASNFGVVLSAQVYDGGGLGNTGYVDHVRMTVYYTPPTGEKLVYLGPAPLQAVSVVGYAGPRSMGGTASDSPPRSTNTKDVAPGVVEPPYGERSAGYPAGLNGPVSGADGGWGTVPDGTIVVRPRSAAYPAGLNGSVGTSGSEVTRSQDPTNVYLGPYYPISRYNIGYGGYYSVVSSIINRSLSQGLSLTATSAAVKDHSESRSSTLSATDVATGYVVKNASDSLAISDDAAYQREVPASASSSLTLTLTQQVLVEGTAQVTDDLSLTQSAVGVKNHSESVSTTLASTHQAAGVKDHSESSSHALSITDTSTYAREVPGEGSDYAAITDAAVVEVTKGASNTVVLTHTVGESREQSRSLVHSLTLTYGAANNFRTGAATSTLTVTQAAVSSMQDWAASSSLALSQSVSPDRDRKEASSDLSLTQSASYRGPILLSATTNVATSQSASATSLHQFVANSLSVTDSADSGTESRSLASSLSATQAATAVVNRLLTRTAQHSLGLSDYVISPSSAPASSALVVADAVAVALDPLLSVSHHATLSDAVGTGGSTYSRSLVDDPEINQVLNRVLPTASLTSVLALSQSTGAESGYQQDLSLSQLTSYSVTKSLGHTLSLGHAVHLNQDKLSDQSHTVALGQSVMPVVVRAAPSHPGAGDGSNPRAQGPCNPTTTYSPTLAAGSAFSGSAPAATPVGQVVLRYPYSSPSLSFTTRAPEYENRESHDYDRVVRESRGGTQQVFRDGAWPKSKRLTIEVVVKHGEEARAFLDFVLASMGREVEYVDHLSRSWRGVILPTESLTTQPGRGRRVILVEFEGELS